MNSNQQMVGLGVAIGVGLAFVATTVSAAPRLADQPFFDYDVRFTNPICAQVDYREPVRSNSGQVLRSKPKNVYCKPSDAEASAARPESVQYKFLEWIRDRETREIFFTYLSFSNRTVEAALCEAARDRGVKITFVLDSGTGLERAESLKACNPAKVEFHLRGNVNGLGYAHNKLFVANPNDREKVRLLFSSGNLSSGTVLHHENWHFITASAKSYFVQAHLCLIEGMIAHAKNRDEYANHIQSCRTKIRAEPEEDVQTFFVPGEGDRAGNAVEKMLRSVDQVDIAAHRFSWRRLLTALDRKLKDRRSSAKVRIITDDDTYWVGARGEQISSYEPAEYRNLQSLVRAGAETKFMETNQQAGLLHHNKFLIFGDRAVFTGAGNLTSAAFSKNFENFYLISIPSVVAKFRTQYERMWNEMASSEEELPSENVLP